jgi:hypothetical protein
MTALQVFAFIIVPASLVLLAYLAVLGHEGRRELDRAQAGHSELKVLMQYPFQVTQKYNGNQVEKVLFFAYKFSLGAFVFSVFARFWPGVHTLLFALIGGLLSAVIPSIKLPARKRST